MKYTPPLVNLAILETLKTAKSRDEIDLFIPYIAIAIKNLTEIPFTRDDIKNQLSKDFGIQAPYAAIDILLARAKKRGLIRIENHTYIPINNELSSCVDQYTSRSVEVEDAIESITEEFIKFTVKKYQKNISKDDAISFIYDFLRNNIGDSASLATNGRSHQVNQIHNIGHLTASFIAYIHKDHKELWPNIVMITRAVMLAGYLTYADQISSRKSYTNLTVYLDTPLILCLLGYSGESKAKTISEMLFMLKKHSVDVAIFIETQREIEGILNAWANDLFLSRYDRFNPKTLELLKHRGMDSAAIETRILLLEKDILSLNIRIQRGFKYNNKYNCDVAALEEKIKTEFHGKSVDPRHDADALGKIHNSRHGELIRTLNQKFSIFITPNIALVDISRDFFEVNDRCIPYVATDKWLTTMFWFKHPEVFKGLPEKMLVTSAYGTMFADNGFWKKFSDRLDSMHKRQEITEEDFILVRYDSDLLLKVHEISVDKGMAYSDKDIYDTVEEIKNRHIAEKEAEIAKISISSRTQISKLQKTVLDTSAEKKSIEQNQYFPINK